MHTIVVVGGGFALLAAFALLGHAFGDGMPGLVLGAKVFIPLWLGCAAFNMWRGVSHGYSVAGEFPIFLGIFAVPAIVAALVAWKLS